MCRFHDLGHCSCCVCLMSRYVVLITKRSQLWILALCFQVSMSFYFNLEAHVSNCWKQLIITIFLTKLWCWSPPRPDRVSKGSASVVDHMQLTSQISLQDTIPIGTSLSKVSSSLNLYLTSIIFSIWLYEILWMTISDLECCQLIWSFYLEGNYEMYSKIMVINGLPEFHPYGWNSSQLKLLGKFLGANMKPLQAPIRGKAICFHAPHGQTNRSHGPRCEINEFIAPFAVPFSVRFHRFLGLFLSSSSLHVSAFGSNHSINPHPAETCYII